jgi:hypothetical protein
MLGFVMNRLFALLIISEFFFLPNCSASEVTHPPTFQQIKSGSNEVGCGDSAIYEALKYTDNDVKILKKQNNYKYILGAAYQYDKEKTIPFLNEYFTLIEKDPAGLSLLISCALQEYEHVQKINFEQLTEKLIYTDPENSYAYYLKAYYFSKIDNAGECLSYMRRANNKKIFNNYFTELSNISIKTSLFLGYSKYVAQYYALGLQHDIIIFSGLSKYLTQKGRKPEFKMECLKMGMILRKNSKTLLNDFISFAVQLRALKELKGKESEIKSVEQEKDESSKILEIAHSIEETYDIPESRQVEYFNDLYSKSETYAIIKLSKEYPVKKQ